MITASKDFNGVEQSLNSNAFNCEQKNNWVYLQALLVSTDQECVMPSRAYGLKLLNTI